MSNREDSLSYSLRTLLNRPGDEDLPLGEILEEVGDKGFGLLLVILSLPSALPIPAAGYSTPFGLIMAALALQMIAGRESISLPRRAQKMKLGRRFSQRMLGAAEAIFSRVEFLIKPRMSWVGSTAGLRALGVVVLIMAGLMMLPIPGTNTAPAMVIFIIGVGLSEEDGLFASFAFVGGLAAVALYAVVIYLLVTQGPEAIETIKDSIKGLLGR